MTSFIWRVLFSHCILSQMTGLKRAIANYLKGVETPLLHFTRQNSARTRIKIIRRSTYKLHIYDWEVEWAVESMLSGKKTKHQKRRLEDLLDLKKIRPLWIKTGKKNNLSISERFSQEGKLIFRFRFFLFEVCGIRWYKYPPPPSKRGLYALKTGLKAHLR